MNNSIIVLPSARAIRHKQLSIEGDTLFLPNYITMSDFISKLCIVKDFKTLDSDGRVLLLLEASDFKSFSKLQIQRNFFTFTKNSSYIFKFFEELSAELYDIKKLSTSDIYGEYEEHIAILQELYARYELLCSQRKLLDKIFLPKLYTFNENFAKTHKNIELHIEGHLTNFELELLDRCTQFCTVDIIFNATRFNTKMQSKFLELGVELEQGFRYKISLNAKETLQKDRLMQNKKVTCESFSEPILQAAFVQKKLYDFVKMGYKPENIAVILPDEKFSQILKSFDEKSNFNFAMGEPFSSTDIYEKLDATCMFIEQDSKENEARLARVGDEFYAELLKIYYKSSQEADILEFLKKYKESFADKRELKIYEEELYGFKNILPFMKEMSIKSLLSVFLQRLCARTLDDVRGGKVTVMGVLETRTVEFDAVVIVDFDDSNVPKKSQKDMFLNTAIREAANLPTMSDRESLQKHYYEMLINKSKEVAISFVKSKESSGSRFLKQLGIKEKNIYSETNYAEILFDKAVPNLYEEQEIVLEYSFKDKKLSATKLKTFLTCKRKYYYRYIKQIENHEIPKDMPQEYEIGLDVHEALKNLYTKKSFYRDASELKKDLHAELDNACGKSELEKYLIAMQKRRMDIFCQNEVKRFNEGYKVEQCEASLETEFAGMRLVGQIDRVDKIDNEIYVLDYKTGSYPLYTEKNFTDATDFQLEFYYLLAQNFGNVIGCGYYDLKESKIVDEPFLREKLALLESHVKDLLNIEDVNFSKCEDLKSCTFCEYKVMCGRE
ncbi:MAG: PD-(D/E)XK nuclease family protein [Sulfurimonas sp.]|uniref:PD-(D/E)XK nuclease family protein n=1 Tax=Sulfurimonas sp. TaxID=2022749 RepID=UPI00260D774D|nr:PD-(D/E)XK nuclease family protein [Sulfurimonas sp.]MDD5399601.1 PD-(D/E)XK nuclease family protein [Sulfurimonas sp.]